MQGTFYGVGVGPGDPELLTLKAIRIIREGDILVIPVSDKTMRHPVFAETDTPDIRGWLDNCTAYQIARQAIPGLQEKRKLCIPMPMIKDKETLKQIHEEDTEALAEYLDRGKDVVFITLGDPAVYSTCLYVHGRMKQRGYDTVLVPGVPSFCAAAARMDMGLVENKEELHVIPASYGVEEALHYSGTKVLMKAGSQMPAVKQAAAEKGMEMEMVENCGMPGERIYTSVEEIPDTAGYYSLAIIKDR